MEIHGQVTNHNFNIWIRKLVKEGYSKEQAVALLLQNMFKNGR